MARSAHELGALLLAQGDAVAAAPLIDAAVRARLAALGADHPSRLASEALIVRTGR